MASYTMELRTYIEQASQYETGLGIRDKIEKGRVKLFDFDYPIFDPDYKKVFETHFIRRFYMREIGYETEERFKFELESYLAINMPYWNKMFLSEQQEFPIFENYKINGTDNRTKEVTTSNTNQTDGTANATSDATNEQTTDSTKDVTNHETVDRTQNQDTDGTSSNDDFTRNIDSNTPDTRLNLTTADGVGVIEYADKINENKKTTSQTNALTVDTTDNQTVDGTVGTVNHGTASSTTHDTTDQTTSVTNTGSGTLNETDDYIQAKTGKIGDKSYASMLNDYRLTLLRLENDIFKEMEERLFMLVY